MTVVYQNNLQKISLRWPELGNSISRVDTDDLHIEEKFDADKLLTLIVNGKHLTSEYDRRREAEIQSSLVNGTASSIHVYGFGLGDLADVLLARGSAKVYIYIFNIELFKYILSKLSFISLFENPRFELCAANNIKHIQTPFTVSPACVELADSQSIAARDYVQIALASSYVSERFNSNKLALRQQIEENRTNILHDHDVQELFQLHNGAKAVVVGAGPSLDGSAERVGELKDSGNILIAVDAATGPLLTHGIIPDYVVSLDGQKDKLDKLYSEQLIEESKNIRLVYFPVISEAIIGKWRGEKYTAYANHSIYDTAREISDRGELFISGSVIHPAVDLAVKMGVDEVILAGCDFSFPGNKSHADGFCYTQEVQVQGHEKYLINGYGESVVSIQNLIVYLRDLEGYIAGNKSVLFKNMTREGAAIKGVTYFE